MSDEQRTIKIAVPYYGALSLPPSGFSRVFFIAEVDGRSRKVLRVGLQVWDPKKELNLSHWLKTMEVQGLICSDNPSPYEVALHEEGIWAVWRQDGEVFDLVEQWAANALSGTCRCGEPSNGWCRSASRRPAAPQAADAVCSTPRLSAVHGM